MLLSTVLQYSDDPIRNAEMAVDLEKAGLDVVWIPEAYSYDAVSNGRAILGLGASGPQVIEGFHGVPYDKPIARTREIIDICRKVWRREVLSNDGLYQIP